MITITRGDYRSFARALLAVVVGLALGLLILAVAHRFSQALSRWALGADLLAPHGSWLWTRFVAWASVSLIAGWLTGRAFRRRALIVALLAVLTLISFVCGSMLYLFGDWGSAMSFAWWFEFSVVALVLPSVAFYVGKRHGA